MTNKTITILTTVYNRRKTMWDLHQSLCQQNNKNFLWIIIDDGSTDSLCDDIEEMKNKADFEIIYRYKDNGGKHTALNLGFGMLETELVFIVDSDDILSEDATEVIESEWNKARDDKLAGMIFLKGYRSGKVIGRKFPKEGIFNDIDIRNKISVWGDKAEVWRTDVLSQYRFPVFENEKYQGENYVWQKIALKYDMMYINKIIYFAEYLEGGLTRTGRILRITCPLGGMENSKVAFNKRFPLKTRVKRAWLFVCYGKMANKSFREIVDESGSEKLIIANYLFGYLLYWFWKYRHLDKHKI